MTQDKDRSDRAALRDCLQALEQIHGILSNVKNIDDVSNARLVASNVLQDYPDTLDTINQLLGDAK